MPGAAVPIIGAVAGQLASKAINGSGSGGSQTVDKSPWEPAQPFLKDLIKDGQSLYSHYQKNPFSDAQKTAYQNQMTMNDAYNNQIMPGLLKGFQGLLGSNFGDISSGLLGGLQGAQQRQMASAPQTSANGQAAQYAPTSFGLLNFAAMNPWTNGLTANAVAQAQAKEDAYAGMTPEERQRAEYEEYLRNSGMYYQGSGAAGTGAGGGGAPSGAPGTGGSPGDSSGW